MIRPTVIFQPIGAQGMDYQPIPIKRRPPFIVTVYRKPVGMV